MGIRRSNAPYLSYTTKLLNNASLIASQLQEINSHRNVMGIQFQRMSASFYVSLSNRLNLVPKRIVNCQGEIGCNRGINYDGAPVGNYIRYGLHEKTAGR